MARMTKAERVQKAAEMAKEMDRVFMLQQAAREAIRTNTCPLCGNQVYVNTTIAGWIQCHGYPDPQYRRSGHENDAKCYWQGFTR